MVEFLETTAFRLVRRLATGQGSSAFYVLIHAESDLFHVEADLRAEIGVQIGALPAFAVVSTMLRQGTELRLDDANPICIVRIDCWSPGLVALLDTHVVRLEKSGAQFLFLATERLIDQLLVTAPNFRNRVTEILRILPDRDPGGALVGS